MPHTVADKRCCLFAFPRAASQRPTGLAPGKGPGRGERGCWMTRPRTEELEPLNKSANCSPNEKRPQVGDLEAFGRLGVGRHWPTHVVGDLGDGRPGRWAIRARAIRATSGRCWATPGRGRLGDQGDFLGVWATTSSECTCYATRPFLSAHCRNFPLESGLRRGIIERCGRPSPRAGVGKPDALSRSPTSADGVGQRSRIGQGRPTRPRHPSRLPPSSASLAGQQRDEADPRPIALAGKGSCRAKASLRRSASTPYRPRTSSPSPIRWKSSDPITKAATPPKPTASLTCRIWTRPT
jgi:hypothetical protein